MNNDNKEFISIILITVLLCISTVLPIVAGVLFVILASIGVIEWKP